MILSVCLIGQTFAVFAAPIGINRLLKLVICNLGKTTSYSLLPQLPGNRWCRFLYSAMVLDPLAFCWADCQKPMLSVLSPLCIEDTSSYGGTADTASIRTQLANSFESRSSR